MPIELKIQCEKCGRPCKIEGEIALRERKVSNYIKDWLIYNNQVLCPDCRDKFFAYQDKLNKQIYEDFIKTEGDI